jgi:hypothetical protein
VRGDADVGEDFEEDFEEIVMPLENEKGPAC